VAAETRAKLIELGTSFIAETVFSHASKLELINAAHVAATQSSSNVLLIHEELAVQRVRNRISAGGHHVPEEKTASYQRRWLLVAAAITRCDVSTVYDRSGLKGSRIVAQMRDGYIIGLAGVDAERPAIGSECCGPSAKRPTWAQCRCRRAQSPPPPRRVRRSTAVPFALQDTVKP
jgi:predicted ABC-type ATPase